MQTARQFDLATKSNYGERMPSDTRRDYRATRCRDDSRAPLLERRAAYLAQRGMSPLWVGSPLRAPAEYRARQAAVRS